MALERDCLPWDVEVGAESPVITKCYKGESICISGDNVLLGPSLHAA